jgi:hypothetical protein
MPSKDIHRRDILCTHQFLLTSSRHHPSNGDGVLEERWMYQGRAELVDQEIIVSPDATMAVGMGDIIKGVGWGGWGEGIRGVESRREFVVYAGEYGLLEKTLGSLGLLTFRRFCSFYCLLFSFLFEPTFSELFSQFVWIYAWVHESPLILLALLHFYISISSLTPTLSLRRRTRLLE